MGIGLGLGIQFYKKAGARLSAFLTWGQSVPARFWGTETPEYWGGIDPQAQIAYDSLIAAGFTTPQGLGGINAAFSVVKEIYGTSDITTAISFFGDPSLAYEAGAGTGTTAGQAIRTLPNIIDPTRATDAVQTTAASQPLLLVHSGANYWQGVGVAGNSVSTPNAVANRITGDLSIETEIQPLVLSGTLIIISKFFAGDGTYFLRIANNIPQLGLFTLSNVENVYSATTNTGFSANQKYFLRVSRDSSTGIIKFFTSLDGISYTQLGSDVSGFTGSIRSSSSIVEVGLRDGSLAPFNGKIFSIKLFPNTTFTSESVSFNPNQYNAATSQTQWTSSTGEVWSINVGTANGYKGLLVDKTVIQGDGIDDVLIGAGLASRQYYSSYVASRIQTNSGVVRGIFGSLGQRNLIYVNTTGDVRAIAVGVVQFAGEVNDRLQLFTANFELSAGSVLTNNANKISGSLGGVANTSVYVLSDGSTGFGNHVFSSGIQSVTTDSVSVNTAMYNYIRSINNNAF